MTSVVVTRSAVAVSTPIAERFHLLLYERLVYKDRTTLARCYVVGRIETNGCCVTKAPSFLAIVS